MAHSFSTNNSPANGSLAVYLYLATLVAAGWTKTKDSDGTTFSGTGVQITSGASGANGLANTSAWFVLQAPAVSGQQRSVCLQRSANNTQWRIKYSYAAGFTGGSPSATQVPSATDEVILLGGGTDASPSFATALPADGGYRFNVCGGDTTIGYSFYWFTFKAADTSTQQMVFMLDVMVPGSFPSADADPAFLYMETNGTAAAFTNLKLPFQSAGLSQGRCYFGVAGVPTWVSAVALIIADGWQPTVYAIAGQAEFGGNNSAGTNGWTSKDDVIPVPYGRPKDITPYGPNAATFGWKGFGSLQKYNNNLRSNMDTLSVVGTKDYVMLQGSALPWDGSTPII